MISQAGITAGQDYGEGVNLQGFEADNGNQIGQSLPRSTEGRSLLPHDQVGIDGGILLGSRLASRLSVYPGDIVTLVR